MGASFFDDKNVMDLFNRYEDLCYDFRLSKTKKIRRLPRYCEIIIAQSIEIINHWIARNWTKLRTTLLEKYKLNDVIQKMHSKRFLKAYKNNLLNEIENIRQYCRRFLAVNNNLVKSKKIDEIIRTIWFIQDLPYNMQKQLIIRHDLDLDQDNLSKIDFQQLVDRALSLVKTIRKLKKIRNTEKRNDKLFELIKRCDESETPMLKSKDSYKLKISNVEISSLDRRREAKHHKKRMK